MELRKEKSCGCVIVQGKKVLLVYEKRRDFWDFPKGHVETGESEVETALREVKEEVGLDVEIDERRRYTLSYIIRNEIEKTVVLFVAFPRSEDMELQSEEIEHARWCEFDEAIELLTYDDWKDVLRRVMDDLNFAEDKGPSPSIMGFRCDPRTALVDTQAGKVKGYEKVCMSIRNYEVL